MVKEVGDTAQQLLDDGVRMLIQLLTAWKNALTGVGGSSGTGQGGAGQGGMGPASGGGGGGKQRGDPGVGDLHHLHLYQVSSSLRKAGQDLAFVFCIVSGFWLVP